MLFKKEIKIPPNHVCVVSRNGCFRQILPSGTYSLHRTLDQTTPIFPLYNQVITGVNTTQTKDGETVFFAYQIRYDITDIYMFTVGTSIWNDTAHGASVTARTIKQLCCEKINRLTHAEAQSTFRNEHLLKDRESTMIFEGLQRYGVTIVSAKIKLCAANIKPYQEDSCGLDPICFLKPKP